MKSRVFCCFWVRQADWKAKQFKWKTLFFCCGTFSHNYLSVCLSVCLCVCLSIYHGFPQKKKAHPELHVSSIWPISHRPSQCKTKGDSVKSLSSQSKQKEDVKHMDSCPIWPRAAEVSLPLVWIRGAFYCFRLRENGEMSCKTCSRSEVLAIL